MPKSESSMLVAVATAESLWDDGTKAKILIFHVSGVNTMTVSYDSFHVNGMNTVGIPVRDRSFFFCLGPPTVALLLWSPNGIRPLVCKPYNFYVN